ncbi:sulfotransferase [bacterium]|nr:sulfotransferase [bacterium]
MNRFLGEVHRQDLLQLLPTSFFAYSYPPAFLAILDTLAQEQGKDIWLEKTPDHIYYLSYIERCIPNAKFIHIWRSGNDVVASLYEVTHKYPRAWGGAWDLDFCLAQWQRAIEISMRRNKHKNHCIICYEELVKRPESILVQLCEFIEVEFTPSMLEEYSKAAENLSMETAGRYVRSVIQQPNSEKFYRVFDEQQQRYVRDRVAQIDVTPLMNCSL